MTSVAKNAQMTDKRKEKREDEKEKREREREESKSLSCVSALEQNWERRKRREILYK